LIVIEDNASFGLHSISVPYDAQFDRHRKHASGWYHGASLSALSGLARRHGYALIAVSAAGGNAFFCRDELLRANFGARAPEDLYLENALRNRFSGTTAAEQWRTVESLPYVQV